MCIGCLVFYTNIASSCQATVSSAPQLWQPASGILMINDMDENEGREEGVPSLALPGNNHFVISASGGKVSIFDIRTFEVNLMNL